MPLLTLQNAKGFGFGKLSSQSVDSAFESISTTVVTSDTTVTLSSLGTYDHLQLRMLLKCGRSNDLNGWATIQFNSSYATRMNVLYGSGSTIDGYNGDDPASGTGYQGSATGTSSNTYSYGWNIIDILDYRNTNKYKTLYNRHGSLDNGSGFIMRTSLLYPTTSAITSITIGGADSTNIKTGSVIALYGIKNSN